MSQQQRKALEEASKCRMAYNEFRQRSAWLERNGFSVSVDPMLDTVSITRTVTERL